MATTAKTKLERLSGEVRSLRAEVAGVKGERRRAVLAAELYLAQLDGRITPSEARRLAARGMVNDCNGAEGIVLTLSRLEVGRWTE